MDDLRKRLRERVQLTTDGHRPPYLVAVREAFGQDVDYAMLVKVYGSDSREGAAHRRYSPGPMNGSDRIVVSGLTGPGQNQYQLRGAEQADAAYVDAPLYPPHKRFFEEAGEPSRDGGAVHDVLQLQPQVRHVEDHPGGSGRRHGPRVDRRGHREAD